MTHRFRFMGQKADESTWTLGEDETRHLASVLKLAEGAVIEVTDGQGAWIEGRVAELSKRQARVEVLVAFAEPAPLYKLSVCVGALKPGAVDEVLAPLIELGVDEVHVFLQKETAKARVDAKANQRWQRLAEQAIKQCKRAHLPRLEVHASAAAFISAVAESSQRFLLLPSAETALFEVLRPRAQSSRDQVLVIGGEKGFAPEEEEEFLAAGFEPVALGPFVLRATTAVVAAAALATARRHSAADQS